MTRAKLIWDFRGPNARKTAEHHIIHLREFATIEQLNNPIVDMEVVTENNVLAFMVVDMELVNDLRNRLKPNRGQKISV